eukprot:13498-Heterococcus_DN1.PRE.3
MHWHSELHAHTGATSAATVATSLHALSHWRSYYTQQQRCATRLPVVDHVIRELYRFNALAERCAAASDTVVNDTKMCKLTMQALLYDRITYYCRSSLQSAFVMPMQAGLPQNTSYLIRPAVRASYVCYQIAQGHYLPQQDMLYVMAAQQVLSQPYTSLGSPLFATVTAAESTAVVTPAAVAAA